MSDYLFKPPHSKSVAVPVRRSLRRAQPSPAIEPVHTPEPEYILENKNIHHAPVHDDQAHKPLPIDKTKGVSSEPGFTVDNSHLVKNSIVTQHSVMPNIKKYNVL